MLRLLVHTHILPLSILLAALLFGAAPTATATADDRDDWIVLTVDRNPLLYNDNVFVLPVEGELNAASAPLEDYTRLVYEYFHDEFDFLILVSNLSVYELRPEEFKLPYAGSFFSVMNDTKGIGKGIYSHHRTWGSEGTLQGTIHLGEIEGISQNILLHELMHRWANFIFSFAEMSPNPGPHWGFSSANGLLGGFDIADLVDHGNGRYTAGRFVPDTAREGDHKPYSPTELYLAGLIPPEDVPDLWVAENGKWLEDGFPTDRDWLFSASKVRTHTIEDIIQQHGERIPDSSQSQRDFRAAVILLIDEDYPLTKGRLDQVSGSISLFSHAGADEFDAYNFYEATGGRATITMNGLSQFLKEGAGTEGMVALPASGSLVSGETVTAELVDYDIPVPGSVVWRWARSSSSNGPWSAVQGETSASYTTTDADAGNYLQATVTYDDASGKGQTASWVSAGRVKIHRYDEDSNGSIERNEVVAAISDFLFGSGTTRAEVIEVISLYLFA